MTPIKSLSHSWGLLFHFIDTTDSGTFLSTKGMALLVIWIHQSFTRSLPHWVTGIPPINTWKTTLKLSGPTEGRGIALSMTCPGNLSPTKQVAASQVGKAGVYWDKIITETSAPVSMSPQTHLPLILIVYMGWRSVISPEEDTSLWECC